MAFFAQNLSTSKQPIKKPIGKKTQGGAGTPIGTVNSYCSVKLVFGGLWARNVSID